jgi:hypothetical protein
MHKNPQRGSFKRMCKRKRWVGPDLDMLGPYPVTNMGESIKKEKIILKQKKNQFSYTAVA